VEASVPRFSPVQIALGAAAVTSGGLRPAPLLVLAVDTPQAGWVLLPGLEQPDQLVATEIAAQAINELRDLQQVIWYSVAVERAQQEQATTWFTGGTLPDWDGTPLAIAVVLEEDNPALAEDLGRSLLQSAMLP
jgi:hypothetical protein